MMEGKKTEWKREGKVAERIKERKREVLSFR